MAVSTHSRPKAAALSQDDLVPLSACFNTQPPEGGCPLLFIGVCRCVLFQHTAARRRLQVGGEEYSKNYLMFQHTAARRRLHQQ